MTHPTTPTLSAVTAVVPSALAAVGPHRRLDRAAGWGVAPHVTITYPFAPPARIDDALVERLAAAIASVPAFECTFARTGWFGTDVLYLDPEPDGGFCALTAAVLEAFPDWPPYGGAFDDPVHHLTVGHTPLASPDELRAADHDVRTRLPVHARIDHVDLLVGTDAADSWRSLRELPLG